jgi:hypothetical protein
MKIALAYLLMAFTSLAAAAEDYQLKDWTLQVNLVPEKNSFMLGEPIYLSFTIHNKSTQDLQVVVGGDTLNGLHRPEKFTVVATRDDGLRVPLREMPTTRPGGNASVGPQKIPANGTYNYSLFLADWLEFKEPGNYTVTATRTLDINKYRDDWRDPANLSHLDVQVRAKISIIPFNRAAFGEMIAVRGRAMLSPATVTFNMNSATNAANALAAIDDVRVIEYFSRSIAESAYDVKLIAVGALARFNNDDALAALKRAARDPDANIRHSSAIALSKSPHPGAINALVELRRDSYYGIRNDVLQTVTKMQSAESLEMIREMTNDVDERVGTEAQRYFKLRTDASKPALGR